MKKIYIVGVTLVMLSAIAAAETTQEEYNYVTKGYKVQIESGLDMKKGYEVKNLDREETKWRVAKLNVLYRIKDQKREIAAYMVVYQKKGNPVEYICIPHPESNEEIMDKYWLQLHKGNVDSSERLQLILFLISEYMEW